MAFDPNHKQAKTRTWGREGEGILAGSHVTEEAAERWGGTQQALTYSSRFSKSLGGLKTERGKISDRGFTMGQAGSKKGCRRGKGACGRAKQWTTWAQGDKKRGGEWEEVRQIQATTNRKQEPA